MNNTKTHGGKRSNAGRKPLPDDERKVCLQIYVKGKVVKKAGGEKKAKSLMLSALNLS
jgi:hypothetical protein